MTESNESITDNTDNNLPQVVEGLRQFGFSLSKSVKPFRWVGYAFLLLTLVDWVVMLVPPQFKNLLWQFQSAGQVVERAPFLLIGLILVFFAEKSLRAPWEKGVLAVLSWCCLGLAVLYLAVAILLGVDAGMLVPQSDAQVDAQFQQQLLQATQIEQQVSQASPEEVAGFIQSQGGQVQGSPDQAKADLLAKLTSAKEELEAKRAEARQNQRLTLIKNAVKWIIGAIVSIVLLIYLWQATYWARS